MLKLLFYNSTLLIINIYALNDLILLTIFKPIVPYKILLMSDKKTFSLLYMLMVSSHLINKRA